jgi:hypothetical protein
MKNDVCGTFDGFSYWEWDTFLEFLMHFADKYMRDTNQNIFPGATIGIYESQFIPPEWFKNGKYSNTLAQHCVCKAASKGSPTCQTSDVGTAEDACQRSTSTVTYCAGSRDDAWCAATLGAGSYCKTEGPPEVNDGKCCYACHAPHAHADAIGCSRDDDLSSTAQCDIPPMTDTHGDTTVYCRSTSHCQTQCDNPEAFCSVASKDDPYGFTPVENSRCCGVCKQCVPASSRASSRAPPTPSCTTADSTCGQMTGRCATNQDCVNQGCKDKYDTSTCQTYGHKLNADDSNDICCGTCTGTCPPSPTSLWREDSSYPSSSVVAHGLDTPGTSLDTAFTSFWSES